MVLKKPTYRRNDPRSNRAEAVKLDRMRRPLDKKGRVSFSGLSYMKQNPAKDGAGGKYTWGNEGTEARMLEGTSASLAAEALDHNLVAGIVPGTLDEEGPLDMPDADEDYYEDEEENDDYEDEDNQDEGADEASSSTATAMKGTDVPIDSDTGKPKSDQQKVGLVAKP